MNTYFHMTGLALSAMIALSGCGSNGGGGDSTKAQIDGEKLFFFYNHRSQEQYAYHSEDGEYSDLNSDTESNFYMPNKAAGRMIYWPHETMDTNGTVTVDEKVVMVNADYDYAEDGNLTYQDLIYLGHFHGEDLAAHTPDEFDPNSEISATYSEAIIAKKAAALNAFNAYQAAQNDIREELSEALALESETLCNFFVPRHDAHEEEDEAHEAIPHYALTQDGELYVFIEGDEGLQKYQGPINLDGVTTCNMLESGLSNYGEAGVFVYMHETKTLYLVDSHGADYHAHSTWGINELLPSSFEPTQMIAFGGADEDHEDHEH